MILLPRLDRGEVDLVCAQLNQAPVGPEGALGAVGQLGLKPHWNLSGGFEISKDLRDEFAQEVEQIARQHGYPDYPDIASQRSFDREICRLLHGMDIFRKAGGETKRASTWAGLTCLDLPHVAVWRHFSKGKGISRDRLQGGPRNFLRRLWLRSTVLYLGDRNDQSPWALIDGLSEDAVVQIIERPSLSSDRRLASCMGLEWKRLRDKGVNMEPVMRLAARRIRATNQTRMLIALNDRELSRVVARAFDYALEQVK